MNRIYDRKVFSTQQLSHKKSIAKFDLTSIFVLLSAFLRFHFSHSQIRKFSNVKHYSSVQKNAWFVFHRRNAAYGAFKAPKTWSSGIKWSVKWLPNLFWFLAHGDIANYSRCRQTIETGFLFCLWIVSKRHHFRHLSFPAGNDVRYLNHVRTRKCLWAAGLGSSFGQDLTANPFSPSTTSASDFRGATAPCVNRKSDNWWSCE